MRNELCKSMTLISIIFIPILFSCASTQRNAREVEVYYKQGLICAYKDQFDCAIIEYNKAIAQNRDGVVADFKNYTNIQPIVHISEIKQVIYNRQQ